MHLLTTAAWYSMWSSIVWGLHSHTNAARRPQFTMQTALQRHLIICTEDVTAARRTLQRLMYRYFLGTRLRLPRRVTLERVPTDWYFLFSACGVDMLLPRPSPLRHRPSPLRHRPSPLRHSHPVGIEILF